MALTIPQIVGRIKADVGEALSARTIKNLCVQLGYIWRNRILDPVITIHVFLLQILNGNTACSALSRLSYVPFSGPAYCKARMRLPVTIFENLLRQVCNAFHLEIQGTGLWNGHRTWLLDGTSFSMPDTKALHNHFGQPSGQAKGCGFPVAHMLALFHSGTGLLLKVLASPFKTHDMRFVAVMHSEMKEGDILVGDRAFASYAHLGLLFLQKSHGLFRGHQKQIFNFRIERQHNVKGKSRNKGMPNTGLVCHYGRWDQVVEYYKPPQKPAWMNDAAFANLPDSLQLREIRYFTKKRRHRITLITTLLDPVKYPARDLAELYSSRWKIETNFGHLKTTMGMDVMHCKTVDGVTKEMYMFALAYNLVRLVMLEAARCQRVAPDRISFMDALRWLRDAKADTILTPLLVIPNRPNRSEPRVIKRRGKQFKLLNKPRNVLRKALAAMALTA